MEPGPAPAAAGPGPNPTAVDVAALRRAIDDLIETFGSGYPAGRDYLRRLNELELEAARRQASASAGSLETGAKTGARRGTQALRRLRREALLANPLLNFKQLLVVRRSAKSPALGLPRNWQSNSSLPKTGFDDQMAILSPVGPEGELTTLFQPDGGKFVGDVDL